MDKRINERRKELFMNLKAYVLLLGILFPSINALGQDKPQLVVEIERVFREQEPRWKIERITIPIPNQFDPFSEDIVLKSGKAQALVSISIWKRVKDAHEVFEARAIAIDNTMGAKMHKTKLSNLGDESYMWVVSKSTAWPTLHFRKGTVNINVFAPSVATAKSFAKLIAEHIPAN